jgi:putative transposase
MRYMLTDPLWIAMQPLVERAKRHKGGQPPVLPDRMFFEALLYLARTGVPWRDLPGDFGAWDAVSNRFRRWVGSGALARLFEAMTADPQFGEVRRVLVDSTIVRAHRHAAGAPRQKSGSAPTARRANRVWAAAAAGGPARSSSRRPTSPPPSRSMGGRGRRTTPRCSSRC